jgi:uncharacterized protein (DUF305 family)
MMRKLSLKTVLVGVGVLGILVGRAGIAGAQAAPAHPAGHEGMKADHAMMMPKDDTSYVQMMQMHHQQGIDMAKLAVDKSSREDVKAFARRMIDAQQKEIEELRRIQQSLKPGAAMHDDHDGMMKGEMDKMMADLRQAQGAAFDHRFIDMMIPHHQQAITMSKPPTKFTSADVQTFAKSVVAAQTAEVKELQQMRKKQ